MEQRARYHSTGDILDVRDRMMANMQATTQEIPKITTKAVREGYWHWEAGQQFARTTVQHGIFETEVEETKIMPLEREVKRGDHDANYYDQATGFVWDYIMLQNEKDSDSLPEYFTIYVVTFTKTLQNWKALVGTTLDDGMYYEVTHDGTNKKTYVDAYKKVNQMIYVDEI